MKLVTDSAGSYLVQDQDPSMLATPSKVAQDLITEGTGGASSPYSWGTSSTQAATLKVDPHGPFSAGFNTGDYSAGFGTAGRGLAGDYASGGASVLSGTAGVARNLYDGTTYLSGGVSQPFPGASWNPGLTATVGWIWGANDAKSVNAFLNGDGNQAYISIPTPFGANMVGAITHAYGGSTALELGIGTPGGLNYGVTPWRGTGYPANEVRQ
ncbi:polymorphic toxin type 22 domain-containing protein [Paraburkholderia sp. EG287B]|uniref:polymorphic toxin type 22 domain-containing protein n=1 Tax=Paraburkholderia sp. EG287B TaxID=3237010 RepID=UPI0034D2C8D3